MSRGTPAPDPRSDRPSAASHPAQRSGIARIDQATLWGMAAGLALMLQPWWEHGLRAGFFVTLAATVGQTIFGRLRPGAGS